METPVGLSDKVAFDVDKRTWRPSVLPGHIVLVTSIDERGMPNVAPKSWVTMVDVEGPIVAFGCTTEHSTLQNILARREYVINVPPERLADAIFAMPESWGDERIRRAGVSFEPGQVVAAPLVRECRAHLECRLDNVIYYGKEAQIFGRVVAASIDRECLTGGSAEQYFAMRPLVYLEDGTYGTIDAAKQAGQSRATEQTFYLVRVGEVPPDVETPELVEEHVAWLRQLRDRGVLLMAGPFREDDPDDPTSGFYVITASGSDEARTLAAMDPFARAGTPMRVRRWLRTF